MVGTGLNAPIAVRHWIREVLMNSEYIEERNGGYYIAGTRISLDSVVYSFGEGEFT
jgi:hypothetical protein